MTTIELTSHPVHAAGGLRMMARHLGGTVGPGTHHTNFTRVADEMVALLHDAKRLCGDDQHDREIQKRIDFLRDEADRTRPPV